MKLINHNEDSISDYLSVKDSDIKRELEYTFDELRLIEDKFYKIFDLNPCPISIGDFKNNVIIDVNDAFLKVMEYNSKYDIVGKRAKDYCILSNKDREIVFKKMQENGGLKNYFCEFKTSTGKKKKGLFSGEMMNFNGKDCIILICQVVNKGFLASIFKTYFTF